MKVALNNIKLKPNPTKFKQRKTLMKNIISGMFAISTYHAANLQRHTPDWMTWSEYRINMTWLGFTDIHSGIQSYFVSIGSEYMANDLNKVNID